MWYSLIFMIQSILLNYIFKILFLPFILFIFIFPRSEIHCKTPPTHQLALLPSATEAKLSHTADSLCTAQLSRQGPVPVFHGHSCARRKISFLSVICQDLHCQLDTHRSQREGWKAEKPLQKVEFYCTKPQQLHLGSHSECSAVQCNLPLGGFRVSFVGCLGGGGVGGEGVGVFLFVFKKMLTVV